MRQVFCSLEAVTEHDAMTNTLWRVMRSGSEVSGVTVGWYGCQGGGQRRPY